VLVENFNIGDYVFIGLEYSHIGPLHNSYDRIINIKDNIISLETFEYDIHISNYNRYFYIAPDSYGDSKLYNVFLNKISFSTYIKTKL